MKSSGLKTVAVLVFALVLLGSIWLGMAQGDREWQQVQSLRAELKSVAQQLGRVQQSLESQGRQLRQVMDDGAVVAPRANSAANPAASAGTNRGKGGRDASWARPDQPIVWTSESLLATDPSTLAGFVEGGQMVVVLEGQPPILTPYRYADTYGRYVNEDVVEGLGRYNPATLEMDCLLAEGYQMDPAGLWLRVKIRDEARFSDGLPVTGEDVRYTYFDIIWNMEIQADRFRGVYNSFAEIKVLSERVIEFVFKEPRFDNKVQALLMPIVPKHFFSRFTPTQINQSTGLMVGSGPFMLAEVDSSNQWTPPSDIVLVRNNNYWGPRPALDSIRYKVVTDAIARLTTFTNQNADMIRPTAAQFANKAEDPEFVKVARALRWYNVQGGWSFICWQNGPRAGGKLTPFSDRRVRMAMTHLIDRDRLQRDIFKNLARPATGPFNTETPQANPNIKPLPYDMARAAELLTEAGWVDRNGDGVRENEAGERFTFQLTYPTGNESTLQMVTYVKDQCARVGIACELAPIDWSLLASLLDRRDFDAITFAWSASTPESDPTQLWSIKSIEGTGDNFAQWRSEEADALITKGRRTIDDGERMKVWHQLHQIWHDDQPYTPLVEQPWLRLIDKRIGNVNTYKYGLEISEMFIGGPAEKAP